MNEYHVPVQIIFGAGNAMIIHLLRLFNQFNCNPVITALTKHFSIIRHNWIGFILHRFSSLYSVLF